MDIQSTLVRGNEIIFTSPFFGSQNGRAQAPTKGTVEKILIPTGFHPYAGDHQHSYYVVSAWCQGGPGGSYRNMFLIPVTTVPDADGVFRVPGWEWVEQEG